MFVKGEYSFGEVESRRRLSGRAMKVVVEDRGLAHPAVTNQHQLVLLLNRGEPLRLARRVRLPLKHYTLDILPNNMEVSSILIR